MKVSDELLLLLARLERQLKAEIVGQDQAIASIVALIQSGELSLPEEGLPLASALLLGPTGVGKTQLVKEVAQRIGGGISVLDCSEYQRSDSLEVLLGTRGTPGRFQDLAGDGAKTVLFDEIEKADRGLIDLLIQILGEGRVTLANGEVVSFAGRYVFLTSNLASDLILKAKGGMESSTNRFVRDRAMEFLRPEILGRLDLVEVFNPLTSAQRIEIGRGMSKAEVARLLALGQPAENVVDETLLAICAKDSDLGVRPMKRRIEGLIRADVVRKLLTPFLDS